METIKWYAMPAGFWGRVNVSEIKMRFKAEGIAVISILLDAIALSPNGRIKRALNESETLDPNFVSTIAGLSSSAAEVVGEVLGILVDDGVLVFDDEGLGCPIIDESFAEQKIGRRQGAERQARYRQKSNALRNALRNGNGDALRNASSNASSNALGDSNVTPTYIHTDRHTYRQVDRSSAAVAAPIATALIKSSKNGGGMQ